MSYKQVIYPAPPTAVDGPQKPATDEPLATAAEAASSSDTPEHEALPETSSAPAPQKPDGQGAPASLPRRIFFQYALALVLLAVLQAPRVSDAVNDLAQDIPLAAEISCLLRTVAEGSGITAAGNQISAVLTQCSPEIFICAVEQNHSGHTAGAEETPPVVDNTPASADASGASDLPAAPGAEASGTPSAMNGTQPPSSTGAKAIAATGNASAGVPGNATGLSTAANATAPVAAVNATQGMPATNSTAAAANATGGMPATNATQGMPATNATAAAANATVPHDKPLVLLVGDSMMMEGLGPALLRNLRGRDDLVVVREAKYSTGLSRMDYFDWPAFMESLVEKYTPDVVIITMGGNDAQDIVDENKKRHFVGTPSWEERYRERAGLLLAAAQKGGAKVIWVGLPIMGYPNQDKYTRQLCAQQKAACTNATSQVFVDTLAVLADEKGEFMAFIKDDEGKQTRIRYKDKIHVTTTGGEMLIKEVLPHLDAILKPLANASGAMVGGAANSGQKNATSPSVNGTLPETKATALPAANATASGQKNATVPSTKGTPKTAAPAKSTSRTTAPAKGKAAPSKGKG